MGSASELDYHLLLASDLAMIKAADHAALAAQLDEVKAMLSGLLQKLRSGSR
jgi:four helix bundle protein